MQLTLPARFADLKLRHLQTLELEKDPIRRVHGVTGVPVGELRKMPQPLIAGANAHLTKLMVNDTSVHRKVITLKGVDYGFIPDWEKFTAGEWIDMDLYTQDFWKTAHKAMSVLYRPVIRQYKDTYTIEPYTAEEDADVFKDMEAPLVAGALLFFWITANGQANTLRKSLLSQGLAAASLLASGGGTRRFTPSPTKTSLTSPKSPSLLSATFSRIWPSCKTWILKNKKQ